MFYSELTIPMGCVVLNKYILISERSRRRTQAAEKRRRKSTQRKEATVDKRRAPRTGKTQLANRGQRKNFNLR